MTAQGDAVLLRSRKGAVLRYAGLRAWDARGRTVASRLEVGEREIRLVVEEHSAEYPVVVDPVWAEVGELTDPLMGAYDWFGNSVSVSGDTAVVGAPGTTPPECTSVVHCPGIYTGAASVFVRNGAIWSIQADLRSPGYGGFGGSVSVSGDTAVVAAPGTPSFRGGPAYVFVRSGTAWSQQQELIPSDLMGNGFGTSVSVDGDTAVIGASEEQIGSNALQGAAYVFVRSGSTWSQQQKLTASDGAASDASVSIGKGSSGNDQTRKAR
jgi:hypothetical protein